MNDPAETASLNELDPAWAWAPYISSKERPWSRRLAGHLLRRAGFGPTWQEIDDALVDGPQPTVERLLSGGPSSAEFYRQADELLEPLLASGNMTNLAAWWLHTMLHSPHPLLEKMTLFWHGHFATSAAKVDKVGLMARQNALLRSHALGSFRTLLPAAAKDPAMLLWLDSASNRKTRPNENFAREVMELFCLGLGQYTERDIKEAARAFTGWEVRREQFYFNRGQHDTGRKTVLGQEGNFDGDQVLEVLLEQPAAAALIVSKLFRYLISETAQPPEALIESLAAQYRRQYDTKSLIATMLRSNLFFSRHALGQRIKSPVELAIGLLRSLEAETNMFALADALRRLGQGVFYPPNVKGWDGGTQWIHSASLLARANLTWALLSGTEGFKKPIAVADLLKHHVDASLAQRVHWLTQLLVGVPLPEELTVKLTLLASEGEEELRWSRVVQALAATPEFQVV